MKFKKYSSIDNHYRQQTINAIVENGLSGGEWVQLLKIHGSNYSYFCDSTGVKRGKRSSFLDEGFMGDHHFDYDNHVLHLYERLKTIYDFTTLAVYGEIYGGKYDHPDVPKVGGYTRIQKEVQYCPENRFACYDIELDGHPFDWDEVVFVCNFASIPLVPVLRRGTFEELLMSPVKFPDPLHERFGLPPIEGNNAEGWVLKPVINKTFSTGSRVILKGKSDEFKEQSKVKKTPKIRKLSDEGNEMKDIFFSHLNENRLRNVYSHGPVIRQKDFGKLMGLFVQDAFNDFRKEYNDRFEVLDLDEQKLIKKFAGKEAAEIIRPHFINIIDGEF